MAMRSVSEPVSLTEKDLAGVKEDDDIKIDKNFTIKEIDPDLLWKTKGLRSSAFPLLSFVFLFLFFFFLFPSLFIFPRSPFN